MDPENAINASPACPECGGAGVSAGGYSKFYAHAGTPDDGCHNYLWTRGGQAVARDVRSHGERQASYARPLRDILRRR